MGFLLRGLLERYGTPAYGGGQVLGPLAPAQEGQKLGGEDRGRGFRRSSQEDERLAELSFVELPEHLRAPDENRLARARRGEALEQPAPESQAFENPVERRRSGGREELFAILPKGEERPSREELAQELSRRLLPFRGRLGEVQRPEGFGLKAPGQGDGGPEDGGLGHVRGGGLGGRQCRSGLGEALSGRIPGMEPGERGLDEAGRRPGGGGIEEVLRKRARKIRDGPLDQAPEERLLPRRAAGLLREFDPGGRDEFIPLHERRPEVEGLHGLRIRSQRSS
jgi:hypothetical protein